MQNIRVIRHPDGKWSGIGAVPAGSQIFTIREIVDERPFRNEAMRRVVKLLAPQLREKGCIGAAPGSKEAELFWKAIATARKTAAVFVDQKVREELMRKIGHTIKKATDIAAKVYSAQPVVLGAVRNVPTDQRQRAVDGIVRAIAAGDPKAIKIASDLAALALGGKPGAGDLLSAIIFNASWSDAGRVLRRLYAATPAYAPFVQVIDRQTAVHRQRVAAR